jgi:hypothetical protein
MRRLRGVRVRKRLDDVLKISQSICFGVYVRGYLQGFYGHREDWRAIEDDEAGTTRVDGISYNTRC